MDIERARSDTPGCRHVLHLNSAGASLMPRSVLEAYRAHLDLEARIGGYEAADEARSIRESTYDAIASLLNADRTEIALMDSATRAWNAGFYGVTMKRGARIHTSRAAYASNFIAFLHRSERDGIEVDIVPSDASGQIDVEALERRLDHRSALIALTHVPTNGGLVNPAAEVGAVARRHDVPFLLDACQSAGQMPIDVRRIGCDVLSATGRKFVRGPRGTGFLYVRRSFLPSLEPMTPDLHGAEWVEQDRYVLRSDARKFELWESSIAADIALGEAVRYALSWGLESIWNRITSLAGALRSELVGTPSVRVHDVGNVQCGIVTFDIEGVEAAELKSHLRAKGINVSVSDPSSTLLDAQARHLPTMIRASVHYYNTESEIDRFCEVVRSVSLSLNG